VACKVVLAKPSAHVSTKYVYTSLKLDETTLHPDIDGQVKALREGDLGRLCACMGNVLESVTIPVCPVIRDLKELMMEEGAVGSMMSGSGPTVFGLFREEHQAQRAADAIRSKGLAEQVFVTDFFTGE
jgi:4-diphosphocytidyl-2-C-methyl-D-erythritol kinase